LGLEEEPFARKEAQGKMSFREANLKWKWADRWLLQRI